MSETTDKVTVNANTLAAVLTDAAVFASTETNRPVLHALTFNAKNGRGQVVGCDSYVLGIFTFDCEGTMSALIDTDDAKRVLALVKAELKASKYGPAPEIVLERDGFTLTVRGRDTTITARLIDGQYPNWVQLIPATAETGTVTFTTKTLGQVSKIRLGTSSKSPVSVTFDLGGSLKPAKMYASTGTITFHGIIMPARTISEAPSVEVIV